MTVRFERAPEVLWRRSLGRVLLRLPAAGDLVVLGASGPALWEALERPRSLDEVAGALGGDFGVDVRTVADDISPVLERLVELSLVSTEGVEEKGS